MKISKNSWHYRFNKHVQSGFDWRVATTVMTTCSYVRTTIFSFLAEIVKLLLIAIAVFSGLALLGCMTVAPVLHFLGFFVGDALAVGVGAWLSTLGFIVITTVCVLIEKGGDKYRIYRNKRQSLLRQTLQDKRDGICTIVEFE